LGESVEAILQVSIAVFFQALSKYFSGKDGSAPLRKNGPYAYGHKTIFKMMLTVQLRKNNFMLAQLMHVLYFHAGQLQILAGQAGLILWARTILFY